MRLDARRDVDNFRNGVWHHPFYVLKLEIKEPYNMFWLSCKFHNGQLRPIPITTLKELVDVIHKYEDDLLRR